MRQPSRRRLLQCTAPLLALGGCFGTGSGPATVEHKDETATETATD